MTPRTRNALLGAVFLALVAGVVLGTLIPFGPPRLLTYTVGGCLEQLSKCRSAPYLDLEGTYVQGSQRWNERGCAMRLELRMPAAEQPVRIEVCSSSSLPQLERMAGDPRLPLDLEHPPFTVRARGHFDGDRFDASGVRLVGTAH